MQCPSLEVSVDVERKKKNFDQLMQNEKQTFIKKLFAFTNEFLLITVHIYIVITTNHPKKEEE